MKTCKVQYDTKKNTIKFDCDSTELVPAYLHYLLEFHKLPESADLIFNDMTVRLIKIDQEYKFERIKNNGTK